MDHKKVRPESKINWLSIITASTAILAVVISIFAYQQNSDLARRSLEYDATQDARNATQDARLFTSVLEVNYYLADSPTLLSGQDHVWISRRQLVPLLIQSRFWATERSLYRDDSLKKYLFIFIINHGPGKLLSSTITNLNWVPKKGQQVPEGITVDSNLNILPSGAFYALLVDVLESPDPIDYVNSTHFELEPFELTMEYIDETDQKGTLQVSWEDIRALEMIPNP